MKCANLNNSQKSYGILQNRSRTNIHQANKNTCRFPSTNFWKHSQKTDSSQRNTLTNFWPQTNKSGSWDIPTTTGAKQSRKILKNWPSWYGKPQTALMKSEQWKQVAEIWTVSNVLVTKSERCQTVVDCFERSWTLWGRVRWLTVNIRSRSKVQQALFKHELW